MGEANSLTAEECVELLRTAISAADGRVPQLELILAAAAEARDDRGDTATPAQSAPAWVLPAPLRD
jgi:dihydrodipicolinate synthase/N-acetylneuraminate lyase